MGVALCLLAHKKTVGLHSMDIAILLRVLFGGWYFSGRRHEVAQGEGFGIRSGIAMLIGVIATTIAAIAIQKLSQFILKKIENHGGAYLRTSPAVGTEVPKISTDVSVSRERSQ